jgi:hypothetical protein
MHLRGVAFEDVDSTRLALDKIIWRILISTGLNFRVA